MSDIFREVDEEMRQQQIIGFVKRYGKYVIAAVLAAIIVFLAMRYLEGQREQEREAAGDRFETALNLLVDEQLAAAVADFAVVAEETGGNDSYGLLARFRQAEALYQSQDAQAAVQVYDAIADDSSVDRVYRDLAGLFAAMAALSVASSDEVLERLEPLQARNNPWHLSAMETAALIYYQQGNRDRARALYEQIEQTAPPASAFPARAQQMLAILGPARDSTAAEGAPTDEETQAP